MTPFQTSSPSVRSWRCSANNRRPVLYARNIDNLGALGTRVERIAQKHTGLNILPRHYPFVAEALLGAITAPREWNAARTQFAIMFGDRFVAE